MLVCDRCGDCYHFVCVGVKEAPKTYWYCTSCILIVKQLNERDITLDKVLIEYLANQQLPESEDIDRVIRAEKYFMWADGYLWLKKDGKQLRVPSIS